MEVREKYVARLLSSPQENGYTECKFINSPQVVAAPWVRLRCQYLCHAAGSSPVNPPLSPRAEDITMLLQEYKFGVIVRREIEVNDILDLGADKMWSDFHASVMTTENECFIRGYGKAFAIGVGNCVYCHHDDSIRPCDFPGKRRPTLEAVGVNLSETMEMIGWSDYLVRDPGDPFQMLGLIMLG